MKKRMLAVMLPVAAFVALAGTGFGVWVFNSTTEAKTSADFTVTNAVSVDGLTLTGKDNTIVIDQGTDADLSLTYTLGATIDIEKGAVGTYTAPDYVYSDVKTASSLSVKYNFTVTLAGGMETYFTASVGTPSGMGHTGATYDVEYTADTSESKDFVITLAWVSEKKPDTLAEYKDMRDDLKDGGQINIAASVASALAA
jgi:hypothetical protein